MRILALSDTHGCLPDLDVSQADCVMIAGDITPPELQSPEEQRPWLEGAFCPWVESLEKPVYLALGNHDCVDDFQGPPNLHYGTEIIIGEVLIFSWSPWFAGFAWEAEEKVLSTKLDVLLTPGPIPSIWLTHAPPKGICDDRKTLSGRRKSSQAIRKAIKKYQPRLVICGHVHTGRGVVKLGNTEIYNVSVLRGMAVFTVDPPSMDFDPVLIEI